jgi:hypothetical protein
MIKIEPQNVAINRSRQGFMPSQVSNAQLDKDLNGFLDRLLELIPVPPQQKSLSDEEVVAALSTDSTLAFAESNPCWLKEVKDAPEFTDRRTGVERRRGTVSKAVGAGS